MFTLMNRVSITFVRQILSDLIDSASYKEPTLNKFLAILKFSSSSISSSSSSSSSLQTITDSPNKSLSNPLYTFLPHNQNPNNIVNLICSSIRQVNFSFPFLHKDILGLLPHLGTPEISRVLVRCQSDSVAAFRFFNWVKHDLGIVPNTQNYCLIIHILTWSREYSLAMKVLSELIELNKRDDSMSADVFQNLVACTNDCNWDPVIFDMLTKAYVRAGLVREGLRSFRKMVKYGFVPSVVTSNCLLNGLLKLNHIDKCWQLYENMCRIGIHPNSFTFNILTNVLCKDEDVAKVNEFLDRMEEEGFDPDIVTYNTLIDSYCKKRRLKDAFYLYNIMHRRGVLPDLVSYTALINGLCREGKVREAHQFFHQMVHGGLTPDIILYNTLICGYCKEGLMHESRLLLHNMIGNRILPDSFTCWKLVEGYEKEGRLISALNIVEELRKFGVPISRDIYAHLIVALCQENRPFAAKSLFDRMSNYGHEPSTDIYVELIECFCNCNCAEEALQLKTEMNRTGMKLNLVTYSAIVECLCRSGRSVEGEFLMREMVESGVQPDILICRALINGFCTENCLEKAESLLSFFAQEFQVYDTECLNAIVRIYSEGSDVSKLMEFQDRMLKVGFVPNSLTCKHVIDGLCKATTNRQTSVGKDQLLVENFSTATDSK